MPRGKFVNHKGRSRHFTSPEELQQESEEDSDQTSGSGSESEDKVGASGSSAAGKPKAPAARKPPANRQKPRSAAGAVSSSESESGEDSDEDSESEARDAKKGVASLIEIENPNRVTKKATQKLSAIKLDDGPGSGGATKPELSRREREQIEKQKARQRYEKLHAAGKTTEAKADLARLALIRQQREEAAAKREAEKKAADGGNKKPGAK
ncbi:28 kDa heat- and acid-stable phosphoprotein [Drosophila ficusphila]|uniref:28 kDa heat- and acid-stable phosphoprotein n=1 Tax=Drosophila ficusphila TaxID=30025 RepID=UPI0007E7BD76|nr:28 kDa heat- and acid-stable phosphoprotein [Drosophila ficusphila]XP_017046003.1 28 kDa heat- and acid-stable phosphoprotein [Drosophila ficusphila]XP_017046004.1 28 kDa heat- and acid-stable phosphoprotein [Drosophila ficusphila]